jgi:cobalt/nickel transport system permease protein
MISSTSFDLFQNKKSFIHSLDPRVKLIATIVLIFSNLMLPDGDWIFFGISWVIIICLSTISRINFSFILKRSLIAIPFTLVAITVIFSIPGDVLTEIKLFNWHMSVTYEGVIRFFSILIRAWLSVQATILLTATTTFPDLAHGLRHLRIPTILITILSFTYRYLFVISSESQRLLQARSARSASRPGSKKPSVFWNAKIAGNMVGQLFLRSYERSDRVFNAMVARGFQGNFLTYNPHQMRTKDWSSLVIFTLFIISLHLINIFMFN